MIDKALSEHPFDGYALYLRGACMNNSGRFQEAYRSCQEGIQAGYDAEESHVLLGIIYMNIQEFTNSEEHLLEALKLNPQNASAMAVYSALMSETGFIGKSNELMAEAMRLDPVNGFVLENKHSIGYNICS
jgi:tetratricopeptide (TPR) repeat protein